MTGNPADSSSKIPLSSISVAVVDYGIGNLRSAQKAFEFIGADVTLTDSPEVIAQADAVVLPGVGSFGPTMAALRATRLDRAVLDYIGTGRPFLGICVGMQVLFESSEESPGVDGLGLIPGVVRQLPEVVRRPQMQWNTVEVADDHGRLFTGTDRSPWLYFVHSFAAEPTADSAAVCNYGVDFAAAIRRGNVFATQFHPEKSGRAGLRILSNFVELAGEFKQQG